MEQENRPSLEERIRDCDTATLQRFALKVIESGNATLIERLKKHLGSDSPLLQEGTSDESAPIPVPDEVFEVGSHCGPFRIEKELGKGGMGGVYLATRSDDLKLKVALKTLTHVHARSRALFEKECRILSGLKHPNIAHLIDAGILPSGRPWLAMEYVEGTNLGDWLSQNKPNLEERIGLFLKICDAVSYAHRQMIIHRDIKPGNIMVQANGDPKLLDFGIAATLNPDTGEQHTVTIEVGGMMTPEYASPEQINGLRLGTASDVYSLGVVLYQVLTDTLPYHVKTRHPLEMARMINEVSITRPSATINEETRTKVQFASRLRGDLDTIVLKALEREVSRRYAGVEDLAGDLRRYQQGLPIKARPRNLFLSGSQICR